MKIGETVDFSLQDQTGATVALAQFRGSPVVLFFYPRADTPGCTIEACEFRDLYSDLKSAGAVLLGISRDRLASRKSSQSFAQSSQRTLRKLRALCGSLVSSYEELLPIATVRTTLPPSCTT